MAIPVLKLNLVPPPSFWRRNHGPLGWALLAAGTVALASTLGLTLRAYRQARSAALQAGTLTQQTQNTQRRERDLQNRLSQIDVEKELPRWKLAEKILAERSLPWSRLTAELERCLVQDVRLKSVLRVRDSRQQVTVRLKAEAKTREAEVGFVEALQKNACFTQVVLEREGERQGGGIEFELTLPVATNPPAYLPLPRVAQAGLKATPAKPVLSVPSRPPQTATPNPPEARPRKASSRRSAEAQS